MKSLKGHLLIAPPKMFDPNFFRTVVLMIQHNEEGALGLVLNRPLEMTLKKAWEQVSDSDCDIESPLFGGGPCDGPLMVLYREAIGDVADSPEVPVLPGLHFTTDRDAIELLVSRGGEPADLRFFVGYAGWSPGQLETELERDLDEGGWIVTPATTDLVFEDPEDVWLSAYRNARRDDLPPGINPKCVPQDPSWN